MKNIKKRLLSLVLAVVMVLSMSMSVFAADAEPVSTKVNVKFYINKEVKEYGATLPTSGYIDAGNNMLESATFPVDISDITKCPVTKPKGFVGLFDKATKYVPTAFDAIYDAAVTQKGESNEEFVYGFDTLYTKPQENGIYVQSLSGLSTNTFETDNASYWVGTSWSFYVIPAGAAFDPAHPDDTYLSEMYPNNIDLQAGKTYCMIYKFNEQTW